MAKICVKASKTSQPIIWGGKKPKQNNNTHRKQAKPQTKLEAKYPIIKPWKNKQRCEKAEPIKAFLHHYR